MPLQTTGQIHVDVDRATAFDFVKDPMRLAPWGLKELSENRYSAKLTNKVSFITLSFGVVVEVAKIDPPDTIEAKITGDAIGLVGRVTANASLQLSEAGPNRTTISYNANVTLAGKLGGLGEPVFRAKSAEVARNFGANLKAAIEKTPSETRV
jgi:uncharacterized protein